MNYLGITQSSLVNGEGVRVVLWVSGCQHRCFNCQNPDSWDYRNGKQFTSVVKTELFTYLDRPYIDGLTLSGGDPLFCLNQNCILDICKDFRFRYGNTKTIWLYTGYVWEDIQNLEILNYIDVLVDGQYVERLRNDRIKWRGSENQRVIDAKKSIKMGEVVLWE